MTWSTIRYNNSLFCKNVQNLIKCAFCMWLTKMWSQRTFVLINTSTASINTELWSQNICFLYVKNFSTTSFHLSKIPFGKRKHLTLHNPMRDVNRADTLKTESSFNITCVRLGFNLQQPTADRLEELSFSPLPSLHLSLLMLVCSTLQCKLLLPLYDSYYLKEKELHCGSPI